MTALQQPSQTNQTATAVDKVIAVGDNAIVSVAEKLAIADVPALGFPFIKQIWEALFNFVADKFTRAFQTGATFDIIDHQVDNEEKAISPALAAVIAAEKTGNADAIKKAIQAYADANSALVRYDGSVTPGSV